MIRRLLLLAWLLLAILSGAREGAGGGSGPSLGPSLGRRVEAESSSWRHLKQRTRRLEQTLFASRVPIVSITRGVRINESASGFGAQDSTAEWLSTPAKTAARVRGAAEGRPLTGTTGQRGIRDRSQRGRSRAETARPTPPGRLEGPGIAKRGFATGSRLG